MTAIRVRAASVLLLAILLAGCSQWRYELGQPLVADSLPESDSPITLSEVLAQLGPPLRLSAVGTGYVLAWEHWTIDEDTLGVRLGALGADIMSVDWGDAQLTGEFLLVTFNRQHEVTAQTFSRWSSDSTDARAIQPIGLVPLVDVDDMTDNLPQHFWGRELLLPIPQAINAQSRPDTGRSGIQQRGTPTGTGQRSLE
ncbi:MAG: hypothetical protein AAGF35_07740 [Pseudomonadota bacterium]